MNLGWIGIGLIALILVKGYFWAVRTLRRDPALGALLVAFVVTATMFYNITEAGFRMLNPAWPFLLLSVLSANRALTIQEAPSEVDAQPADSALELTDSDALGLDQAGMSG